MARRITLAGAAKVAAGKGWSEKRIRAILAEDSCPLSVELGGYTGARHDPATGETIRFRQRLLDIDEFHDYYLAHGGTDWRPELLPPPTEEEWRAELAVLTRERDALRQRVLQLETEFAQLRLRHYEPMEPVTSAVSVPAATLISDAPVQTSNPDAMLVPVRDISKWAHGLRTHPVFSSTWRQDAQQAREGLILFHTFARLCGIPQRRARYQAQYVTHKRPPHGRELTLTNMGKLKYLTAEQREQWRAYWQEQGDLAPDAPTEEQILQWLADLTTWNIDDIEEATRARKRARWPRIRQQVLGKRKRERRERSQARAPRDLPPGCQPIGAFARLHGLDSQKARNNVYKGKLQAMARPSTVRPGETVHYFDEAQQAAAVAYWATIYPEFRACPDCAQHGYSGVQQTRMEPEPVAARVV